MEKQLTYLWGAQTSTPISKLKAEWAGPIKNQKKIMKTYKVKVYTDRTEWRNEEGKLHREDGPAIERNDGSKFWYLNGQEVTEEEHRRRTQKTVELTLDDIADKYGIPVEKLKLKK